MEGLADNRAWNCLTKEEQQSLSLTISYGKSSWEVGEIMGITHYKYLELKERAERLFRLFHDFFSIRSNIFRPNSPLDQRFKDYVEGCVERRVTKKKYKETFGDSALYVTTLRTKFLVNKFTTLSQSEDLWDIDTYKLIQEFDRWNNWRILPRKLQQPSAYKRRNNRRDIFYLKYMCNISSERVQNLIDKYWWKGKDKYYVVVFDYERFDNGYQIVPINTKESTLSDMTRLFIYVFEDRDIADVYGYLVIEFQYGKKSAKKGQAFWPNYRQNISQAINYKGVNNMDFYAEKLDFAYKNSDKRRLTNIKEKHRGNPGITRSSDAQFYK